MDRRKFVGGLLAAPVAGLLPGAACAQTSGAVDVVAAFGFVPDGRTDNYEAFHRWSDHVNRAGGGHYVFPAGHYFVARHRTGRYDSRDRREVINAPVVDCRNLVITGHGAKIRLMGRFHRSGRIGRDGVESGRHAAIFMPFEFRRCRNLTIAGFEIDGGVRETTRDKNVWEAHAFLIGLHACSDVRLQDLNLHHCQTDAVHLSDDALYNEARPARACRNIVIERCRLDNNGRGGLAALQVYGLSCTDCAFNGNGYDIGRHAAHAPGFGICMEPDRVNEGVDIDTRTGNLIFTRCEMNDNISAFLAAYPANYKGYLRIIDCRSRNGNEQANHMIVAWPGALIQGGVHDAGSGTLWASWEANRNTSLTMRDVEVRSSGHWGIFHNAEGNSVTLERVKLVGTHKRHDTMGYFPAIQGNPGGGRRNVVRECDIFIPAARWSPGQAAEMESSFNHCLCENNLFRSDLPAAGGRHFAVQYGPGTSVRGDRYRGTAPGTADSIRPEAHSTHDTRRPYSKG